MNKNSNTYQILYSAIMVVVVGAVLAFVYMALRPRQERNIANDKRQQILSAVHITAPSDDEVEQTYNKYIVSDFVIDNNGNVTDSARNAAFDIDMKANVKLAADKRQLPVFKCRLDDGSVKYIIPVYGAGLWGAIWGYVAVDADGSTIYGAVFRHEGETPGLGAEIAKPAFSDQFDNKTVIKDNTLIPVEVVKKGLKPEGNADYVDGISGGTITSKGVSAMLNECLTPYKSFLEGLASGSATAETQPQQTH